MQSSIVKTLSLAGVTLSLMGAGVPSVVAAADANTAGQPTEQTTSKPGETAKPGDKDKPATGTDTGKPVTPPVTTPAILSIKLKIRVTLVAIKRPMVSGKLSQTVCYVQMH